MVSNSIYQEFSSLTNNQAYTNAFCKRVMLPSNDPLDPFIGNTQRKDFIPLLTQLITQLPTAPHIFDVGGGSGELVTSIIKQYQLQNFCLSVEEPHQEMLAEYILQLKNAEISIGETFDSPIQALYEISLKKPADLIISSHMIYHLTDWSATNSNPTLDLTDFICFLYAQLKPGGKIFLIYADQETSFVGQAGINYYKEHYDDNTAGHLAHLYRVRNQLLAEAGIQVILEEKWPEHQVNIKTMKFDSVFYGQTKDDLAAMALVGELVPSNDEAFDIEKLVCARIFLENYGELIGLQQELTPCKRQYMWRANQPQVACIIEKCSS